MTYDQIVDYLFNLPRFAKGNHMENCIKLLKCFGNPQDSFKYIHVAGTNGKGSVCAYMESVLRVMGKKTGFFSSPHLIRVNERMRVDGVDISDEDFVRLFYDVKHMATEENGCMEPTFFEYIYVMAMLYFKECGIEYGVIETGLGGRLDFTNVVKHPVLTVLTSISFDHMSVLGDTIEAIADEKAGIIKTGTPLVYYGQDESVSRVVEDYVKRLHIDAVKLVDEQVQILSDNGKTIDFSYHCGYDDTYRFTLHTVATYQSVNAALAFAGLCKSDLNMTADELYTFAQDGFAQMHWPGRMEMLSTGIYVDGAHNLSGIEAFVDTIRCGFKDKRVCLIFAVADDKDYSAMIQRLCSLHNLERVIVTEIENGRRCHKETVVDIFRKNWNGSICDTYNIKEALQLGTSSVDKDMIVCCVGSLYLVGSVKELWRNKYDQL